ncbi:MAG TPA: hypothetical protein PKX15_04345 [Bacteroidales bacterium]|nr:hypothetical protein [Bacteroidales bacterium]
MHNPDVSLSDSQRLDLIYHAIPEWVHRRFPGCTMEIKIQKAFEHMQQTYTDSILREVNSHSRTREFLAWTIKQNEDEYWNVYWKYLMTKGLPENPENKKGD